LPVAFLTRGSPRQIRKCASSILLKIRLPNRVPGFTDNRQLATVFQYAIWNTT
jgi:hypothetical protein